MVQWVERDRTLVGLQVSEAELAELKGEARFYDEDLGFVTAVAFRPMTEDEGRNRFGHLRLA